MSDNVWGGMIIEAVSGGGYIVREWTIEPGRFSPHLFACSSKAELVKFISANLVTTDVTFPIDRKSASHD